MLSKRELPTKEYIDSPPVYKSRPDQRVAGLMLGLQQPLGFQSMKQHSSEMYNSHNVSTDFQSQMVKVLQIEHVQENSSPLKHRWSQYFFIVNFNVEF